MRLRGECDRFAARLMDLLVWFADEANVLTIRVKDDLLICREHTATIHADGIRLFKTIWEHPDPAITLEEMCFENVQPKRNEARRNLSDAFEELGLTLDDYIVTKRARGIVRVSSPRQPPHVSWEMHGKYPTFLPK